VRQGDPERAGRAFSRAVQVNAAQGLRNENAEHSLIWLARLAVEGADFDRANRYLAEARLLFPSSDRPWLEQSEVYRQAGEWALAVQAAREALARRETARAYYQLAVPLEQQGDVCGAFANARLARELAPGNTKFRSFWMALQDRHPDAAQCNEDG
jgi:tetratricopeptide (TPR) repeat protein